MTDHDDPEAWGSGLDFDPETDDFLVVLVVTIYQALDAAVSPISPIADVPCAGACR